MTIQTRLEELRKHLDNFTAGLSGSDLRAKVLALVPAFDELREIGSLLIPRQDATAARSRILFYFRQYPFTIISHKELMVVSGISEFARRIRELRVEKGWNIVGGQAAKEMKESGDWPLPEVDPDKMDVADYVLLATERDLTSADRWHTAKEIRNSPGGSKDKVLKLLQAYVGTTVTGEELRYAAKDASEWARRIRELRTEEGWLIYTKSTGDPDLEQGVYMLKSLEQAKPHDRHIPDPVRAEVLDRDKGSCRKCGWNPTRRLEGDPRQYLELHHLDQHAHGGTNDADNLITLCNMDHKTVHREDYNRQQTLKWVAEGK